MKTKIILSGCGGKMGHAITALVAEREDCEICAGVDLVSTGHEGFPVFPSIFDYKGEADVLIDFSHPSVLDSLLASCAVHHRLQQRADGCRARGQRGNSYLFVGQYVPGD